MSIQGIPFHEIHMIQEIIELKSIQLCRVLSCKMDLQTAQIEVPAEA